MQKLFYNFCVLKNQGENTKNIFQRLRIKYFSKISQGQMVFQELETYIFANQINKNLQYEQILLKYNLLILHVWILQQGLASNNLTNYFIKNQLDSILYKSAANYIYQFDDNYNQDMKQELERNQLVIQFVLDDFFNFQFTKKPLEQIVSEDILLCQEKDPEKINNLCKYIKMNVVIYDFQVENIKKIEQKQLRTGKIQWVFY